MDWSCYHSVTMKKQTHLHLRWLECELILILGQLFLINFDFQWRNSKWVKTMIFLGELYISHYVSPSFLASMKDFVKSEV